MLDPDEGRRSYQRRLRQAETASPGHVADLQGQPIAGAIVKRNNSSWTATTDACGKFPLPDLKPNESTSLSVSAKGFLPLQYVYLNRMGDGQYNLSGEWPLQLARPATISGRVLGLKGKPLAFAPAVDGHAGAIASVQLHGHERQGSGY